MFVCVLIQATDLDLGVNGQVRYQLVSHRDLFRISTDGSIFTAVPLDREERAQYDLVVQASDGAKDPRRTTVTLSIKVLDVDDNSPAFFQPAYHVTLPENSPVGMIILNISVSYTHAHTYHIHIQHIKHSQIKNLTLWNWPLEKRYVFSNVMP